MPQGFEIIRARTKDNAAVLIDRLMRSKQEEVVLVLPKNSIIVADLNSLKILKEEAESIGRTLSLSTENNEIKSFAKKIRMSIYDPDNLSAKGGSAYGGEKIAEPIKPAKKIKVMTDILPPLFNRAPEAAPIKEEREDIISEIQELPEEPQEEPSEELPEEPRLEYKLPPEPVVYETASQNSDLEKNLENFYGLPASRHGLLADEPKPKNRSRRFHLNHVISFFAGIGLLLFGATMYLVLPKANISISLKEIPLKVQIPIAVSKNVSSSNLTSGIIPGQYFSLDKTGSKTIERSSVIGGIIEIYNAYSAAPQRLVAQTRFETKDGKIFQIQNPIIIPGAKVSGAKLTPSSVKAEVVASGASEDYLIDPSYFTIPGFKGTPKYAGFYAKSFEPMTAVKSVSLSKAELLRNKKELQDKLAQELKTDTLNTLKDSDLQLIDGASIIRVDDFKVNSNMLSMKVNWQALFFKEKDLRTMINYFTSSHYQDLNNFTFEDSIAYPKASRVDFKKGELFFTFNIDKSNALPADLEALKKELAGRDEIGMRAAISSKTYISGAAIFLWPFWVKKAPDNLNKINITIDN